MEKLLSFTILLPFQVFFSVINFVVWEFFSNGSWKRREFPQPQPARLLQDEAVYLRWKMRKMEEGYRASIHELEKRNRENSKLW